MPLSDRENTRANNQHLMDRLQSENASVRKEAAGDVNTYLRLRAREDGFSRRIQPPEPVVAANFDRQVDTVKPVIVKDMEPNSAGAYSVPFGTVPDNQWINARRYRVMFDRIMTYRYTADVADLLTYDMDIRQIFNDLMLKDLLFEEDRKYMYVVDTYIVGGQNDTNPATNPRLNLVGALGNITAGVMTRDSLAHSMKGLPSTNRHLNPASALVNNVTIWDVVALEREQIGGDLAEEMFTNGFAERTIMGLKWMVTIKTDLIPNDVIYHFAAPKFLGDFYTFEDVTVSTKHENFLFEMFGWEMIGATIKNEAAVARIEFSGSKQNWNEITP
jgi:hypothetical protein